MTTDKRLPLAVLDRPRRHLHRHCRPAPGRQPRHHKLLSENPEQYRDAAVAGCATCSTCRPAGRSAPARGVREDGDDGRDHHALLERRGEPTLLVTTQGFRDALRIGYQERPRIFDRQIVLPELLLMPAWSRRASASARTAAWSAAGRAQLRAELQAAYDAGLRSARSSSCTATATSRTRRRPSASARAVGFAQISVSHRGQPADEARRPRRHHGRRRLPVADPAPLCRPGGQPRCRASSCMFMQVSGGGLTDAHAFQGRTRSCPARPAASSAWCGQRAAAGFDR